MTKRLVSLLAQTLAIDPSAILSYSQDPDGSYTVILLDFRKHTGVIPAAAPAPAKKQTPKTAKKTPSETSDS